jgi:hypothetical protein
MEEFIEPTTNRGLLEMLDFLLDFRAQQSVTETG